MHRRLTAQSSSVSVFHVGGEPLSEWLCHRHASHKAVAHCVTCLRPLCESCIRHHSDGAMCLGCQRGRRIQGLCRTATTAAAVVVLIAMGGGLVSLHQPRVHHGVHAVAIRAADDALSRHPCSIMALERASAALLTAHDPAGALRRLERFRDRCDAGPQWHRLAYAVHRALGDVGSALDDAQISAALAPEDAEALRMRAEAQSRLGDDSAAAADYRRAAFLQPGDHEAPLKLARVLEKRGHACEAKQTLQRWMFAQLRRLARADFDSGDRPGGLLFVRGYGDVRRALRDLVATGCDDAEGYALVMPLGDAHRADAELDGMAMRVLIGLDEPVTRVSRSFAEWAGLDGARVRFNDGAQLVDGERVRAGSLVLHGLVGPSEAHTLRVPHLDVIVVDDGALPAGVDAIIGADVLGRLRVRLLADGLLELDARPLESLAL